MLSEKSPQTILPVVLHMASLWRRWSRLTDIVKGGGVADDEFDFSRDTEELRAFIGAMHSIGAPMAKRIVAAVDPGAARSLLDVGGGSGTYTIAFLQAVPGMRATLFDLPEVIEMARERLKHEGLLDRTTLVAGSFYLQKFPEGHDLALISAIIHSNSLDENLELYRKVFRFPEARRTHTCSRSRNESGQDLAQKWRHLRHQHARRNFGRRRRIPTKKSRRVSLRPDSRESNS